jgi:tRNA(Arg) A34 adenosine deaminase TadA
MIKNFLQKAIELSEESSKQGGFPVGAIIVKDGIIISDGLSGGKNNKDVTGHAEIEAIRNVSKKLGTSDLSGCEIYSSMEPCLMCFSACYWANIEKIFYAVGKDKLPEQYFEGLHSLEEINLKNNKKIDVVHVKELEGRALFIVENWEDKNK